MKQLKKKYRNKKGGFVSILAATLGASLLGNMLADNREQREAAEETNTAGQYFNAVSCFNLF